MIFVACLLVPRSTRAPSPDEGAFLCMGVKVGSSRLRSVEK